MWQISSLALASEVNPRLDLKRVGFVQRQLMHVSVSDTQLLVFVVHWFFREWILLRVKTGILFTSNYHHLPWKKMWHLILKIQNSFHLAMICAKFCWNTQVPGKIMSQNVNSLKKLRKTLDSRNQKSFTEPSFTWPNNTFLK